MNRTVKDKGKLIEKEDMDTREEVKLKKRKLFLYFEIIYINIFKWTGATEPNFQQVCIVWGLFGTVGADTAKLHHKNFKKFCGIFIWLIQLIFKCEFLW